VVAEHVAQDQDRALAGRQQLKRGYERQRDRFAGLVAGLRAGRAVRQLVQEGVRVGLEPDDLAEAGRLW
jgi:hypothetical protein